MNILLTYINEEYSSEEDLGVISHENLKRFIMEGIPFYKEEDYEKIPSKELEAILLPEDTQYDYTYCVDLKNYNFKSNGDLKTAEEIEAENRQIKEKYLEAQRLKEEEEKARKLAIEKFHKEKPYEAIGNKFISYCEKYVAERGNTKGLVKAASEVFNTKNTSVKYGNNNGGLNSIYLKYTDKESGETEEIPFLN